MSAALQMSFFEDTELLPYREVWHYRGERWELSVQAGTNSEGAAHLVYRYQSDRTDHWGGSGARPSGTPVMQIVASVKAGIIHGPHGRSRAEIAQELQDALSRQARGQEEEVRQWQG